MNTDKEFKKGAEAFKEGKKESQNPYNVFTAQEKHAAWQRGYWLEQQSGRIIQG